jgi:hypothetical protein
MDRTAVNREIVTALRMLNFVDARRFILRFEPQPDGVFHDQSQDSGADSRIGENAEGADRLPFQLSEAAAVEQSR